MCGICGIYNTNSSKVDINALKKMNSYMVNRGPDDEGYYSEDQFGFAMRRLSIIDLKTGKQPIFSNDKRYVVTFNGEIYNYLELRKDLIKRGYIFYTNSDTEVIANMFQYNGVRSFRELNGMFAIAIWDREKRRLFLVRDRIGIKPLFYYYNDRSIAYSSHLLSLARHSNSTKLISQESLLEYLAFSYVPIPRTIFKNIWKIEPGTYIQVNRKGIISKEVYWDPKDIYQRDEQPEKILAEELDHLIENSISIQKRSDVPIGTFLSGGFDSSTVVAKLSNQLDHKLKTFTITFEHGINEAEQAKKIARLYDTNHTHVLSGREDIITALPRIIEHMDEPLSDNSIFPTYILSEIAVQNGVKVIFNGTGGDELFYGYPRYNNRYILNKSIHSYPKIVRQIVSVVLSGINKNVSEIFNNPAFDYYRSISGIDMRALNKLFREKIIINKVLGKINEKWNDEVEYLENAPSRRSLSRLDIKDYLVNDVLALLDKMTMAVSLEGRVPLLDNNIIDFALSINENQTIKNRELKWLLKNTMSKHLPKELFNMPKLGFSGPVNIWVMNYLKSEISNNLIHKLSNPLKEIIDEKWLNIILQRENLLNRYSNTIFSLFIFNKWYNKHIY